MILRMFINNLCFFTYNMNNKSQITIFILIGLVILLSAIFLLYLKSNVGEKERAQIDKNIKAPFELQPIKAFVDDCLKEVAENGLILIGKQGGYYNLPKNSVKNHLFKTAYYYNKIKLMPSLTTIENEISSYINEGLDLCINNFTIFEKLGYDISQKRINAKTTISKEGVFISVNLPLEIKKNEVSQKIENFNLNVPYVHLKTIHNISEEMVNEFMEDEAGVCLSCLYELSRKNNIYANMLDYLNNTLIFTLKDYNISLKDKPYNFTFAIKYEDINCNNLIKIKDTILIEKCIEEEIENLSAG